MKFLRRLISAFAIVAALGPLWCPALAGWETSCNSWTVSTLDLCANQDESITGAWTFGGATTFTGPVTFSTFTVSSITASNLTVGGNLSVTGTSTLSDTVTASKGVTTSTLTASGAATLQSTLAVTGTSTLSDTVTASKGISMSTGVASGTFTITNAGAGALDVTGGINAGSGNVGIVDTSGKIPALSSTYIADLSGANLTALTAANINAGSLGASVIASSITLSSMYGAPTLTGTNITNIIGANIVETGTNGPVVISSSIGSATPAQNAIYSELMPKVIGYITNNGTAAIGYGVNITSVTRTALGQIDVMFQRDFASASYVVVAIPEEPSGATMIKVDTANAKTAHKVHFITFNNLVTTVDTNFYLACFGKQ